jgi:hypothetical protein
MAFTRGGRRILWKGRGSPRDDIREPAVRAVNVAIFEEPRGLPPAWPYDHMIHLLLGTTSVAVRPYRYPQL